MMQKIAKNLEKTKQNKIQNKESSVVFNQTCLNAVSLSI